jgi:hypothetical protein
LTQYRAQVTLLRFDEDQGGSVNSGKSSQPGATGRREARRRAVARWAALGTAASLIVLGVLTSRAAAEDASEDLDIASDLSPSGALAARQGAALTPTEQVDRAKEFVAGVERAAQSIQRQLQSARKDRDVVRVLCLNDKLNQVDVALRSAQDRMSALNAAAARKDADRARHEYTVLEVLSDRVRALVEESSQCVGEETGFIGEAEVSVSIDPNLPDGDTGFGAESYALPAPPNISSPIE